MKRALRGRHAAPVARPYDPNRSWSVRPLVMHPVVQGYGSVADLAGEGHVREMWHDVMPCIADDALARDWLEVGADVRSALVTFDGGSGRVGLSEIRAWWRDAVAEAIVDGLRNIGDAEDTGPWQQLRLT